MQEATGCTIWLTGQVSPVSLVMRKPEVGCRISTFYQSDGIDATTGEMNPRHAHCVTLYHNGLPAKPIPLVVAATYTSPFIPPAQTNFTRANMKNLPATISRRRSPVCRPLQSGKCYLLVCLAALWPNAKRHTF